MCYRDGVKNAYTVQTCNKKDHTVTETCVGKNPLIEKKIIGEPDMLDSTKYLDKQDLFLEQITRLLLRQAG